MNRKFFVAIGCVALVLCFSLNVRNTLDDYGIQNISLKNVIWAQNGSGSNGSDGSMLVPCLTETMGYEPKFYDCFYCVSPLNLTCYRGPCDRINLLISASYTLKCVKPDNHDPKSICREGKEIVTYDVDACCRLSSPYYELRAYTKQCKLAD
ncbi:MAG: hypothetical protein LBQ60_05420 [Bacteroidales bacterium]|jgi:hypothetical protein|nr:hypothetical protein [Bacteroidales bacterium]